MQQVIQYFNGDYHFLSNFHPSPMRLDLGPLGKWAVDNVEQVYQAAKAEDYRQAIWVLQSNTPGVAKARGRKVKVYDEWEEIKQDVMEMFVRAKFDQNPDLKQKLLDTGDAILEEGNRWGDRYWGMVNGVGQNHLGKILMKVRNGYQDK